MSIQLHPTCPYGPHWHLKEVQQRTYLNIFGRYGVVEFVIVDEFGRPLAGVPVVLGGEQQRIVTTSGQGLARIRFDDPGRHPILEARVLTDLGPASDALIGVGLPQGRSVLYRLLYQRMAG